MNAVISLMSLLATAAPLEPCTLDSMGLRRVEAKCGSVTVALPAGGGATSLDIGFAVLEATGKKKKPDPVVVLPGGPGQAATELGALLDLWLAPLNRERDIVLFDPRGTGRSHKLTCKDDRSREAQLNSSDDEERAFIERCGKALPFDARTITTTNIAADLDAVRQALGVEQWNLVGISYGTRLALVYDRAFPGRARTLVLDGVVPFSMVVGDRAASDAEAALTALDARCQKDAGCAGKSLMETARALRARLDAEPRQVTLADPLTGRPRTVRVDGRTAFSVVHQLLYSDEGAAILPVLLRAAEAGDLAPLTAQLFMNARLEDTLSRPMQLSVLCAEDAPFMTPTGDSGLFPRMGDDVKKVCDVWPHAETPASFHDELPASNTPALLLSGSADPITPPANANAAKKSLTDAKSIVGIGLGHNLLMRGCVPEVIDEFVDRASSESLDIGCLVDLKPFPVFVDAMGPSP